MGITFECPISYCVICGYLDKEKGCTYPPMQETYRRTVEEEDEIKESEVDVW